MTFWSKAPGQFPRSATAPELRLPEGARPDVGVVLVAAGESRRTAGTELKQFRWVAGKPMLLHALHAFQRRADVALVVCVLPRQFAADPPPWIFQSDLDRLLVCAGGSTRGDSVLNGLEELDQGVEVAVIHDAARPLVSDRTISAVIAAARQGTGAVAALPVVDTLKEVDSAGRILRTVSRQGLWRAQTPQAFPRWMIEQAYVAAGREGVAATDDATLCERLGFPVVVVPGSERAMKITVESDFSTAEALAQLHE
jgi:2-C-methyl-D-erythritol 4-phosphate cytidylyltransferase